MILDKNHFIYQSSHKIYQIAKIFHDHTGFHFLNHIKFFNSSTVIDWATYFFKYHYKETNFDGRLNIGMNYWEKTLLRAFQ